jgi:glutathione S-transferase
VAHEVRLANLPLTSIHGEEYPMPLIESPTSPLVSTLRGVHLFHFEGAPCAQRVRFALREKGLLRGREVRWNSAAAADSMAAPGTWTSRHVSLIKNEHLSDAYAQLHPHLVVPALVHDGRLYLESMDIVQYLGEAFPDHPLVPRQEPAAAQASALVEHGKALHVSVRYVSFHWGLRGLGKLNASEEARLRRLERPDSPEQMTRFYVVSVQKGRFLRNLSGVFCGRQARMERGKPL